MATPDEFELWFDNAVTDGLPVVPPSRERVERMLAGTRRSRDDLCTRPCGGRVELCCPMRTIVKAPACASKRARHRAIKRR